MQSNRELSYSNPRAGSVQTEFKQNSWQKLDSPRTFVHNVNGNRLETDLFVSPENEQDGSNKENT